MVTLITEETPMQNVIIANKKPAEVKAQRMDEAFEVCTSFCTMRGRAGDYLVEGANNCRYVVAKEIFEAFYVVKQ